MTDKLNKIVKNIIAFIFVIAACVFFYKGIHAINSTTIWANYFVGIFFVFLAFLNRFRRFKIFGIAEAEMWDEKQEEVACLLKQLKKLAITSSKSIVHLLSNANRLAKDGEHYKKLMKERTELVIEIDHILTDCGCPHKEVIEITDGFSRTMREDVVFNISSIINDIYQNKIADLDKRIKQLYPDELIDLTDEAKRTEYETLIESRKHIYTEKDKANKYLEPYVTREKELFDCIENIFNNSRWLNGNEKEFFLSKANLMDIYPNTR